MFSKYKISKVIFGLILILFISFPFTKVSAADGDFVWAKKIGDTTGDYGYSITTDSSGNVYTTGYFTGTVDFDPGAGTSNLTSAGNSDIFVSKLDSSGTFVWAKKMGGTDDETANCITTDSSGNVYTTGSFNGTVDFDPDAGTSNLTSAGNSDIFVSKLDSSGTFVWAKKMGGSNNDAGYGIKIDSSGNVYTTGSFQQGPVDFDPGAGTSNLTSPGSDEGMFISKLDSSGTFVWAKQIGGILGDDRGNSIFIDTSGNVYTTGYFADTADFDPGAGTSNLTSASGSDIFISKLDSSGNFVWAKSFEGADGSDRGNSIYIDSSGNVYTTGYFYGTIDFNPGAGTSNLISAGDSDAFISKLDSSGVFVWVKQIGGSMNDDVSMSITIDSSGNVYTTGSFYGTIDFNPGAGVYNLTAVDYRDMFISKLDSSGVFVWAKKIGSDDAHDEGSSITIDSTGNLYTTGFFWGTVDFDPGAGTSNLTAYGSDDDIFILKLEGSDLTAPIISEVTPVSTPSTTTTPSYTFTTDEAGTITYGGSCSSGTTSATLGSNTITFTALAVGTYSNCTIIVTDAASNASNTLTVTSFTITAPVVDSTSHGSVPVWILQAMSDRARADSEENFRKSQIIENTTNTIPVTLDKKGLCTPVQILTQNLKAGARNGRYHPYTKAIVKEVAILQAHMNRLGFNAGQVDGILGPITDGAIKRMQKSLGTKEDGLVGPNTRDLINNSCVK